MSIIYPLINEQPYKFILRQQTEEKLLKKIKEYLNSQKTTHGFPIVIFADYLPPENELATVINCERDFQKQRPNYILALKNKSLKEQNYYWRLLELGFEDIIEWEDEDEMISYFNSKYERNKKITDTLESALVTENMIGSSLIWKRFLAEIIEVSFFSQASVLLIGESGTGKELICRLVHTLDKRIDKKKLIIVDCTTIVPELSGSELFGHERGSYTSAVQSREGAFALANGGTLFLDEIGELPLPLQAELLRVLQEGTYKKVGSNTWQKTNFRLVCATNKDLRKAMNEGRFRQDLYYRIADCEYHVPSLHERKEDIPAIVNYFLARQFTEETCPAVDKLVMDYLVQRNYPGNIRELKQLIQRIALKHVKHKKITIGEVPIDDRNSLTTGEKLNGNMNGMETLIRTALLTGENWWNLKNKISETAIQVALDLEGNNKQKAAERLSVDVRTVQQYVKRKGTL
jgi:transcriptional regulator with GAF, ATPase, and Fis domain